MIVYHGTDSRSAQDILENGINLRKSSRYVDNGPGFYTTPSKEFAARRAKIIAASQESQDGDVLFPVVLEIVLDDDLLRYDLRVKKFDVCDYSWKEFILYNRLGKRFLHSRSIQSQNHNLDFKYDIVVDDTADARVNKIVYDLRRKKPKYTADLTPTINRIDISNKAVWGKQMSFHTKQSLQCIKSMKLLKA